MLAVVRVLGFFVALELVTILMSAIVSVIVVAIFDRLFGGIEPEDLPLATARRRR